MSVSLKRQVEAARKAYDETVDAVFALAPNGHTRFSDCLALADAALKAKHKAASSLLIETEGNAVIAGKAWRNSIGGLMWYR